MKSFLFFLILCFVAQLKKTPNDPLIQKKVNFESKKRPTATLIELDDISLPPITSLELTRLEYNENLLEEQQKLESQIDEVFDEPYLLKPKYDFIEQTNEINVKLKIELWKIKLSLWLIWIHDYCKENQQVLGIIGAYTVVIFCAVVLLWAMMTMKNSEIQSRKKKKFQSARQSEPLIPNQENEPFLSQSMLQDNSQIRINAQSKYSIMESNTESSNQSQRVNDSQLVISKYRITEYRPEIRDPLQESFVRQSIKQAKRKHKEKQQYSNIDYTSTDLSLLEIDELLKEMSQLNDEKLRQVEQLF